MKTAIAAAIAASLFAAASALAGHEGHDAQAPDEHEVEPPPAAAAPCPPGSQALFDVMLSNLQVQMEAIRGTDDPDERRRLLRNHLQTLREALDLVSPAEAGTRGHARPQPRPAEGKGKGKAKETGMGMMRESPMHRDMEQRVERLQRLLEQMIEHEQAEAGGHG